jgi:hypothetical protein
MDFKNILNQKMPISNGLFLLAVIFTTVASFCAMAIYAVSIIYDPTKSQLEAGNVQDAIDQLDANVDNIQTIPGPDGPAGNTGPSGPTGPRGQGSCNCPKFTITDANGNFIGYKTDDANPPSFFYIPGFNRGYFRFLDKNTGDLPSGLYYALPNCQGQPYITATSNDFWFYQYHLDRNKNALIADPFHLPDNIPMVSFESIEFSRDIPGECKNLDHPTAYDVSPLLINDGKFPYDLPFTTPILIKLVE